MNIINKFYHVLEADRCSRRNKKVLVVQQMGLQSEMGEGSGLNHNGKTTSRLENTGMDE